MIVKGADMLQTVMVVANYYFVKYRDMISESCQKLVFTFQSSDFYHAIRSICKRYVNHNFYLV